MRRLKEAFFNGGRVSGSVDDPAEKKPVHHDGRERVSERADPRLFTRAALTGLTGISQDAEKIMASLADGNTDAAHAGAKSIFTAADELLSMIE